MPAATAEEEGQAPATSAAINTEIARHPVARLPRLTGQKYEPAPFRRATQGGRPFPLETD